MRVSNTGMASNAPCLLGNHSRHDQSKRPPAGCTAAGEGVKKLRGQAMTFDEVLEQVRELLQSKGRVAYRALKRRFDLDDEYLEDLKAELIDAEHVARDEGGKVLVWTGKGTEEESGNRGIGEKTNNS